MANLKSPEKRALDAALKLLEAGDKSCREVRQRLEKKSFAAGVIDAVLGRLETSGLLDDRHFAEQLAERLTPKAGRKRIAFELRRRGVADAVIEEQMVRLSDEDEQARLNEVGMRQWRRASRLEAQVRRRKVFGYLARSGFEADMIRSFFEKLEAGLDETL